MDPDWSAISQVRKKWNPRRGWEGGGGVICGEETVVRQWEMVRARVWVKTVVY